MNTPDTPSPNSAKNDNLAIRLLERALLAAPEDWETRGYLLRHAIAAGDWAHARALLKAAPSLPLEEEDLLTKARVEASTDDDAAILTLTAVLERNKACARAHFLLAEIRRRQGLREEARRSYGIATLIDEKLADPEWEAWLGNATPGRPPAIPPSTGREDEASDALTPEEIAAAVRDATGSVARPVTFEDIGGMAEVIERIRLNIIHPFRNPGVFKKFNRVAGGGILLYGPPGCGKTHIARATAGECRATFLSIGITEVLSMWIGEGERHLHNLFEMARRRSPSVLFIDEIDAIGMDRREAGGASAPLVNMLLTEMDGFGADNTNVMVLAATNSPWRVDHALSRPGRFDRVLFVPPPDAAARVAILEICLRGMPHEPLDLQALAQKTHHFSGADLRALVTRASEQAILTEMRTGRESCLTQRMLADAIGQMKPSTVEWLETARNYCSYANRGGLYDELAAYLER